ncbi:hypothetical protein RJ639_040169 [Escallonia herrerae]|uniref:Uncharacterized protein n=1 Tax=Escallonia herrerae TaxID=1293975 RepID=A0AA88WGG0_9ASTE|nr:hypothetical protein RJ639_040169 [Escallonia herrerae]
MGTEVHRESYLRGYYSMRDINDDSTSSNWPIFYGDKTLTNGQYYNGFIPRTATDAYPGYDKDLLKQKMLEHEAIFKNQVHELHRLYRIQRDMMEEVKRKELHKHRISIEASSSSSLLPSQMTSVDARKWHIPSFPVTSTTCARPSMLGAEVINSPLSCTKGNSAEGSRVPFQNGYSSKDCEVLGSRPSKVRKKLFDLQLSADEYIDNEEGEQLQGNKTSHTSSFPNGSHEIAPERSVKFFFGGGGKSDAHGGTSTSDSCMKNTLGLDDLNEPIQIEAANAPESVDFLGRYACHREIRGLDLSAKPKSQYQGSCQELFANFQHGSKNGTSNNLFVENKGNGKEWFSYMYEAGNGKRNLSTMPQSLQPDKSMIPSHPMPLMFNRAHQSAGNLPTDHSRGDPWRERIGRGLEISEQNQDHCNFNNPGPVVASRISSPYPFVSTSDLANSWSHPVSSWGRPSSCLTQKLASIQSHPYYNSSATFSRNPLSSDQNHQIFDDKWNVNGNSRLNPVLRSELPTQSGLYHGTSSGSKDQRSIGFDYLNCNTGDNVAAECVIDRDSQKIFKGSNFVDLNSTKDVNLNMVPKTSSDEPVHVIEIIDEKRESQDHLAALPWLRAGSTCKNGATGTKKDSSLVALGFFQPSSNQLSKSETPKGPNDVFPRYDIGTKKEVSDNLGRRKILGFTIDEDPCTSRNDSSSLVSTSASLHCAPEGEDAKIEQKHRGIDINVACDPTVPESGEQNAAEASIVEKGPDKKDNNFRNHIDLNSCMSEDEGPLPPAVASTTANLNIAVEIDLEAPVVLENEEAILPGEHYKHLETPLQSPPQQRADSELDLAKIAAEAIVAISSSGQQCSIDDTTCHQAEASPVDPLVWFAEVASFCADNPESKFDRELGESSSNDIDYFEVMTLQLSETKEEDYMPKPFVPEIRESEETGATLQSRSRKGQARRGRQRRDFQRDILPGLTSLSRHEVTEDLQIFGGLMRATGHPWASGSTRRNGTRSAAARGRRRLVADPAPPVAETPVCPPLMQQLTNIEVGLEDRSLTGWGKTTRRPRRQRCPAGNPSPVLLT